VARYASTKRRYFDNAAWLVRSMPGHAVRCDYLAYYDMGHSYPEQRAALRLGETVRLAHGAARPETQAARLWRASDI
jgi:hypothetical protein